MAVSGVVKVFLRVPTWSAARSSGSLRRVEIRCEWRQGLLEQGLKGTHPGVAVKTAREGVVMGQVCQRQEGISPWVMVQ